MLLGFSFHLYADCDCCLTRYAHILILSFAILPAYGLVYTVTTISLILSLSALDVGLLCSIFIDMIVSFTISFHNLLSQSQSPSMSSLY